MPGGLNLGPELEAALSRGLDLALARFIQQYGSLQALEQEIQRRVPDMPPPARITLANHVSRASEAAAAMAAEPDQPFDRPELIPVNEFVGARFDPTDRFVYVTTVSAEPTADVVIQSVSVDVASPIALSLNEVSDIAGQELERRKEKSPEKFTKAQTDSGYFSYVVDVNGVFRVY